MKDTQIKNNASPTDDAIHHELPLWDVCAPLGPTGTWLIEASAGTGKTWQLASLVARLVVEHGVPIQRILIITFTNAATAELRGRVRDRLVQIRDLFILLETDLKAGRVAVDMDDVSRLLCDVDREERARRLLWTKVALSSFDIAPISTIHGFCQRTLDTLAFESGQDAGLTLIEDLGPIRDQLVADALASVYARASADELIWWQEQGWETKQLGEVVRAANAVSGAQIQPEVEGSIETILASFKELGEAQPGANPLAIFAHEARRVVRQSLIEQRALTFDAILTRLAETIEDEVARGQNRPLADAIAAQYDAVFVDEFQDTDAAQWRVLREVFTGRPGKRTFLIGDPKQAIYAFRGADVFVYLAAKSSVPQTAALEATGGRYTMGVNWRSDAPLLAALDTFWGPGTRPFGPLNMDFTRVIAAPGHQELSLAPLDRISRPGRSAPSPRAPLEIRWLDNGPDPELSGLRTPLNTADPALRAAATACAREIRLLLDGPSTLPRATAQDRTSRRRLTPGDFAVLVQTHKQAALTKRALAAHGIMAVHSGKDSVFESKVAVWLLKLLDALGDPSYDALARTCAITPLFGYSLADLAEALGRADRDDPAAPLSVDRDADEPEGQRQQRRPSLDWNHWRGEIARWAERWSRQRFIGVIQPIVVQYRVIEGLLGMEDGDRLATDLRHLIELCHVAERQQRLSPAGLADWLRRQREEGAGGDVASPRLESDAEAVQIVTDFKAKGLQYPIVMLPFSWTKYGDASKLGPIVIHSDEAGRASDLGDSGVTDLSLKDSPLRVERLKRHKLERRQERIRRLYVAMTRAEHHCVIWAGPLGRDFAQAPINALLLREAGSEGDIFEVFMKEFKGFGKIYRGAKEKLRLGNRVKRLALDKLARDRLDDLTTRSEGTIGWRYDTPASPPATRWRPADAEERATSPLAIRSFDGRVHLGSAWMRASFSSMIAGRTFEDQSLEGDKERALSDDDLRGGLDDVDGSPEAQGGLVASLRLRQAAAPDDRLSSSLSSRLTLPLAAMWGGTTVGTWAHAVLEHLDFQPTRPLIEADFAAWRLEDPAERAIALDDSPFMGRLAANQDRDGSAKLVTSLGVAHGHRRAQDHAFLTLALPHILNAPLSDPAMGPYALREGFCLAALPLSDRVDELAFDCSLAGGEDWLPLEAGRPGRRVDTAGVSEALRERAQLEQGRAAPQQDRATMSWDGQGWLDELLGRVEESEQAWAQWEASDPERRGAEPTRYSILPRIAGLLTGFVDLVFRAPCRDGQTRYFVVDYKTNRLSSPGDRETRPGHYTRPWLAWAMGHSGYHLQGLIYSLAVHRFLRERVRDYNYNTHFGGHLYLYLRGMAGDDRGKFDGELRGVYADRWPREVIERLDEALDPELSARRRRA